MSKGGLQGIEEVVSQTAVRPKPTRSKFSFFRPAYLAASLFAIGSLTGCDAPMGENDPAPGDSGYITVAGKARLMHDHRAPVRGELAVSYNGEKFTVDVDNGGNFSFEVPETASGITILSRNFSDLDPISVRIDEGSDVAYGSQLAAAWSNERDARWDRSARQADFADGAGDDRIALDVYVMDDHQTRTADYGEPFRDAYHALMSQGFEIPTYGFPAALIRNAGVSELSCVFEETSGRFDPGTRALIIDGMAKWADMVGQKSFLRLSVVEVSTPQSTPYWLVQNSPDAAGSGWNALKSHRLTGEIEILKYIAPTENVTQPKRLSTVISELAESPVVNERRDPATGREDATGSNRFFTNQRDSYTQDAARLAATQIALGAQPYHVLRGSQ